MQSSGPLDQIFFFLCTEFGIVEFLLPSFKLPIGLGIEESTIRSLELTFIRIKSLGAIYTSLSQLIVCLFITETERVHAIWTLKEMSFTWISLNIFPAGV